eukprot:CAMPEP_0169313230 /NCGR_PEP_ID=MMETSP1017-20121227/4469_1 /TAXON_ID=342587 /ORGANISM="Karlodinium micrum, Strain CCMP2283" /LENGTH=44 /DNA_ID= /DNA_START= /DNA_END= /DNA_ORIENTATION=
MCLGGVEIPAVESISSWAAEIPAGSYITYQSTFSAHGGSLSEPE